MAKFKITKKTTVSSLKKQFYEEIGAVLRIYDGRSEADEKATLVSLGAVEGEIECRTSRTVGKFIEAFKNECNLKVKVYTKDNKVSVLDGVTLSTIKEMPNGVRKSDMDSFTGYRRDGVEGVDSLQKKDSIGSGLNAIKPSTSSASKISTSKISTSSTSSASSTSKSSVSAPKGYEKILNDINRSKITSEYKEYKDTALVDLKFKSVKLPNNELDKVNIKKLLSNVVGKQDIFFVFIQYGDSNYLLSSIIGMCDLASAVSNIKRFLEGGEVEDDDDVTIYVSTYAVTTAEDEIDEYEGCISMALSVYTDGGEGDYYSYDWSSYLCSKLLLRVDLDGNTDIFMANSSDCNIDFVYMDDEEFDNLFVYYQIPSKGESYFIFKGKLGVVNSKGKIVFQPVFDIDYIYEGISTSGICGFSIDGKFGLVDIDNGTFVTEFKYDKITEDIRNGFFNARLNGVDGILDKNGNFSTKKKNRLFF